MSKIHHNDINVNGIRLHIAQSGSNASPSILFLHGFPEFWYAWRHQLNDLADEFHCLAPDTRGINLSEKPEAESAYVLANLVEDARQLIATVCQGEAVVVVGHDWGGFIAWELALQHPEIVRKLVIINCPPIDLMRRLLIESPKQQAASKYMLAFRSERGEELLSRDNFAGFRANILQPGLSAGYLTDADVKAYMSAWNQPGGLTGGLNYYRANRTGPPTTDHTVLLHNLPARQVNMPTLVLWGEQDPYFSLEVLDLLPDYVPDLQLHRFPENDHWIVHQQSPRVSQLIGEFSAHA